MNIDKLPKNVYPRLMAAAIIFIFYWLSGKRKKFEEANLVQNSQQAPELWDVEYSRYQIQHEDIKQLRKAYENNEKITSAYQSVIDFAKEIEKPKILEVGFGEAGDLIAIKNELKDAEIYGVESSDISVKNAKTISDLLKKDLNLMKADAYNLPFYEDTFDIVFLSQVFEHLPNPTDALKEQIRVTKNGGHLILGVPQLYHTQTIIKHALMHENLHDELGEIEYSVKEIKNMLIRPGLKIEEIVGRGSLFDEWIWGQMCRFLPKTSKKLKKHFHKNFSVSIILTSKKIKNKLMH